MNGYFTYNQMKTFSTDEKQPCIGLYPRLDGINCKVNKFFKPHDYINFLQRKKIFLF